VDYGKKKKLEAAGWRVASADEFLDLTAQCVDGVIDAAEEPRA